MVGFRKKSFYDPKYLLFSGKLANITMIKNYVKIELIANVSILTVVYMKQQDFGYI